MQAAASAPKGIVRFCFIKKRQLVLALQLYIALYNCGILIYKLDKGNPSTLMLAIFGQSAQHRALGRACRLQSRNKSVKRQRLRTWMPWRNSTAFLLLREQEAQCSLGGAGLIGLALSKLVSTTVGSCWKG